MDQLAKTVITKINKEAEQLVAANGDINKIHKAMGRIHLLSELWLESNNDGTQTEKQPTKSTTVQTSDLRDDDSESISVSNDDTSIFDF